MPAKAAELQNGDSGPGLYAGLDQGLKKHVQGSEDLISASQQLHSAPAKLLETQGIALLDYPFPLTIDYSERRHRSEMG